MDAVKVENRKMASVHSLAVFLFKIFKIKMFEKLFKFVSIFLIFEVIHYTKNFRLQKVSIYKVYFTLFYYTTKNGIRLMEINNNGGF